VCVCVCVCVCELQVASLSKPTLIRAAICRCNTGLRRTDGQTEVCGHNIA